MNIEVEDLKKINLLPGETLVVRINVGRSPIHMKNFESHFKKIYPDNQILFIPDHMEIYKIISEEK